MTQPNNQSRRFKAMLLVDDPTQSGHAKAINNSGQIAVTLNMKPDRSEILRPFLWDRGKLIPLSTLNYRDPMISGTAEAINDRGDVVGESDVESNGCSHAVLWREGKIVALETLQGYQRHIAYGINTNGLVVGAAYNDFGRDNQAVLWENGRIRRLGTLGGRMSTASAVNDRNQIVGQSTTPLGTTRAFLWEDGEMTDLGTLGGAESRAFAINASGVTVGRADTTVPSVRLPDRTFYISHGCIWNGPAEPQDLFPAESVVSGLAKGINDAGGVVGQIGGAAFFWKDGIGSEITSTINTEGEWKPMFAHSIDRSNHIAGSGMLNHNVVPVVYSPVGG